MALCGKRHFERNHIQKIRYFEVTFGLYKPNLHFLCVNYWTNLKYTWKCCLDFTYINIKFLVCSVIIIYTVIIFMSPNMGWTCITASSKDFFIFLASIYQGGVEGDKRKGNTEPFWCPLMTPALSWSRSELMRRPDITASLHPGEWKRDCVIGSLPLRGLSWRLSRPLSHLRTQPPDPHTHTQSL